MHAPQVSPSHANVGRDALAFASAGSVQLGGQVGERVKACEDRRIWAFDASRLTAPLADQRDSGSLGNWRGEYWGKWCTAAVLAHSHRPSAAGAEAIMRAARQVVAAQEADGYLGHYRPEHRHTVWDIWCRKYVQLGLLAAFDFTGDDAFLAAARRNADHLIAAFAHAGKRVVDAGLDVLQGTAESSSLEPFALLYQRTGDERYLRFAEKILAEWNEASATTPQGLRLLERALGGEPPYLNHAYSIMSCFEGVCELYRATGDERYRRAAVQFGEGVIAHELMIDGSVSNQELFCCGRHHQTELLEQPQETCATVTWMKLCGHLLRLTGESRWADHLEQSLYNAMLGAMTPENDWFAYHLPLAGERVPSHLQQEDVGLSCCVASGPRGLLLTPRWAVMQDADGPVVNYLGAMTVELPAPGGGHIRLVQTTDYPANGRVELRIEGDAVRAFVLRVRVPGWCKLAQMGVNDEAPRDVTPGRYAVLARAWRSGDVVTLNLALHGRAVPAPNGAPAFALTRGPIVLCLDNRLVETSDLPIRLVMDEEQRVELTPSAAKPEWAWLAFEAPFAVKPQHFFKHYTKKVPVCDFASAGNAWSADNLYRTWLPQPLYLPQAFPAATWKMLSVDGVTRPGIPRP